VATLSAPCAAQTGRTADHNLNGWYMYFGDHPIGGKWGVHLEGQWRRADVITNWQQLLLRTGVNYDLNDSAMLTGGYAYVATKRYGDFPTQFSFPEHRIWQQLLVRQRAGPVSLQHRYRSEQRLIGEMIAKPDGGARVDNWRYQNRFRYFVKGSVPLRGDNWYVAPYAEVFLHFAPNFGPSAFDQLRLYCALGYNLSPTTKVEFGYLQQIVAQRNGRVMEYNHALQIALFSTAPLNAD
jgi:hypothetical protein